MQFGIISFFVVVVQNHFTLQHVGVSTNGAKSTDIEILEEVCGINNAVLSDNDQDYDDEDGAVPTRPNTEEINQAI